MGLLPLLRVYLGCFWLVTSHFGLCFLNPPLPSCAARPSFRSFTRTPLSHGACAGQTQWTPGVHRGGKSVNIWLFLMMYLCSAQNRLWYALAPQQATQQVIPSIQGEFTSVDLESKMGPMKSGLVWTCL